MDTKSLGNWGEDLACEYLVEKGFKILGRNWRIPFGELDIIAQKKRRLFTSSDKTVHIVEVKTLATNQGFYPEEHVNEAKQHKLRQLAQLWLMKNKYKENHPYQIDIIAVTTQPKPEITFFENAVSGK
jgi:putative endonuclease